METKQTKQIVIRFEEYLMQKISRFKELCAIDLGNITKDQVNERRVLAHFLAGYISSASEFARVAE